MKSQEPRMKSILDPAEHTFASILGHDVQKQYLIHAVESRKLPHALLIAGAPGIGRTSFAYALAKYVNCPNGAPTDCFCNACRKIRNRVASDLLLIEPRSASGQLTLAGWKPGKDDPENLQYYRFVETPPLELRKKVLIFRNAERMNISLSNYLLKLIEEPPSYLLNIFLAPRLSDVIATIRSRCAPLSLSPLSHEQMLTFSEMVAPSLAPHVRQLLVTLSEGRPGKFLNLLQEDAHGEHAAIAAQMNALREHGSLALFGTAYQLAQRLADEGDATDRLRHSLDAIFAWLRDAILVQLMGREAAHRTLVFRDVLDDVQRFSQQSELEALVTAARHVAAAYEFVPRQTDRTYVLELVLMRLARTLRSR
jgi:DNA polymerase III delta prime subunit